MTDNRLIEKKDFRIVKGETENSLMNYYLRNSNLYGWDEVNNCIFKKPTDSDKSYYATINELAEHQRELKCSRDGIDGYLNTNDSLNDIKFSPAFGLSIFKASVEIQPDKFHIKNQDDKAIATVSLYGSSSKDIAVNNHAKKVNSLWARRYLEVKELVYMICKGHSILKSFGINGRIFDKKSNINIYAPFMDKGAIRNKRFTLSAAYIGKDLSHEEKAKDGCIYKKYLRQKYYIGTNIISIDIDNVFGFPSIEDFYYSLPLPPTICYETFSDGMPEKGRRFRLIYCLTETLYGLGAYKIVTDYFQNAILSSPYIMNIDPCSNRGTQIMYGTSGKRALYADIFYNADYIEKILTDEIDKCIETDNAEYNLVNLFLQMADLNHADSSNNKKIHGCYYKMFTNHLEKRGLKFKVFNKNNIGSDVFKKMYKMSNDLDRCTCLIIENSKSKKEQSMTILNKKMMDFVRGNGASINCRKAQHEIKKINNTNNSEILNNQNTNNLKDTDISSFNNSEVLKNKNILNANNLKVLNNQNTNNLKDTDISNFNNSKVKDKNSSNISEVKDKKGKDLKSKKYKRVYSRSSKEIKENYKSHINLQKQAGHGEILNMDPENFARALRQRYSFYGSDFKDNFLASAKYTETVTGIRNINVVIPTMITTISNDMSKNIFNLYYKKLSYENFLKTYSIYEKYIPGYSKNVLKLFGNRNFIFQPENAIHAFCPYGDKHLFGKNNNRKSKLSYYIASLRLSAPDMTPDCVAYYAIKWANDHLEKGFNDDKVTCEYLLSSVNQIFQMTFEDIKVKYSEVFNSLSEYFRTKNNIIYKKGHKIKETNMEILDWLFNTNLTIEDNIIMMNCCYGYSVSRSTIYAYLKTRDNLRHLTLYKLNEYNKINAYIDIFESAKDFKDFRKKYRKATGVRDNNARLEKLYKSYLEETAKRKYNDEYNNYLQELYKKIDEAMDNLDILKTDSDLSEYRMSISELSRLISEDLVNNNELYNVLYVRLPGTDDLYEFSKYIKLDVFRQLMKTKVFKTALINRQIDDIMDYIHASDMGPRLKGCLLAA